MAQQRFLRGCQTKPLDEEYMFLKHSKNELPVRKIILYFYQIAQTRFNTRHSVYCLTVETFVHTNLQLLTGLNVMHVNGFTYFERCILGKCLLSTLLKEIIIQHRWGRTHTI